MGWWKMVSSPAGRVAFRYPNFRCYMAARFLTTIASEMQAVAVAWQVYGLTHRPLDLGLVGLAQFLPGILLYPLTGHTADRLSRRKFCGPASRRSRSSPCSCCSSRGAGSPWSGPSTPRAPGTEPCAPSTVRRDRHFCPCW